MGKIKIALGLLIAGLFMASPVFAASVSIQKLPTFINTDYFKLSCTVLGGGTAQFSVNKHGAGFVNFGPAINLATDPCQVQVTGSQVNDHTDYTFRVTVGGDSDSTSTTFDVNGPDPVSGYYKETSGTDTFKLHWRNPNNSDFDRVIIYRGETPDFTADSGHEIAQVLGGANSDMTFENHVPDPNKTFYFDIRAIDQAGNSSSLIGDVTNMTTTATPTPAAGGTVQVLPREPGAGGNILSKETSVPSAEPTAEPLGTVQAKATSSGLSRSRIVGIGALVVLLGLVVYFFTRKRS